MPDQCLLSVKQSIKEINKSVKKDLKSLLYWLNANKISLNVTKTEVVIFRAKGKVFDTDLKLKMCGKKLYLSHHVKYLGVYLDECLWGNHATELFRKMKIIKFVYLVSAENCIFINKYFSCKSYYVFSHLYDLATGRHNHQTRFAMNGLLKLPNYNTAKFGTKTF